jgi:hypothetical protein
MPSKMGKILIWRRKTAFSCRCTDAVVAARSRLTVVPARIRHINHALQDMGIDWSAPPLVRLDPGLAAEQPT